MAQPAKKKYTLGFSPFESYGSIAPFDQLFDNKKSVADGFDGVDCVILWGGTDVHPSFYKQKHHPLNQAAEEVSKRDIFEWKTMLYCRAHNIPMIGVCRGAQFLCVGAGGSLVQHCVGHGYDHHIDTILGKRIKVTSSHHQMMNPHGIKHTLIGWTDPARCTFYDGEERNKPVPEMMHLQEPEIVYFPQLRGLAIQGHPEYAYATKEFVDLSLQLVEDYLLKDLT